MVEKDRRSAWTWIPSLYFAQGIPYVVVMTVSVIMYKRLGISNADIALYTSWLYLPWVIKPFWSPVVDIFRTKRWWIVIMQLLVGAGLAGVALTIPVPGFFQYTLAFFWLLAFSSATHDIAADGFYMLGLKEHEQAYFVGIRSTFYRVAMITGQGLLIILAGFIETRTGLEPVRFRVTAGPGFELSAVSGAGAGGSFGAGSFGAGSGPGFEQSAGFVAGAGGSFGAGSFGAVSGPGSEQSAGSEAVSGPGFVQSAGFVAVSGVYAPGSEQSAGFVAGSGDSFGAGSFGAGSVPGSEQSAGSEAVSGPGSTGFVAVSGVYGPRSTSEAGFDPAFEQFAGLEAVSGPGSTGFVAVSGVYAPGFVQSAGFVAGSGGTFVTGSGSQNGNSRMEFVLTETDIEISTRNISAASADSMLRLATESNIANGFAETERIVQYSEGWFARNVSGPLGAWLKRVFGTEYAQPDPSGETRGNIRLIGISLSSPPDPGDEIVLNTGFQRGDGSIRLVRGDRLVFDNTNWDRTGWIAIQLDPSLDRPADADFEGLSGNIPFAWSVTFFFLAGLFVLFLVYHKFFLPFPLTDKPAVSKEGQGIFDEFLKTFSTFFQKKNIGPALAFILLYRLGEAQIVKLASPFMLDPREIGGLGLTTGDVGLIYGTIGIIALTLGGITGGVLASRRGLKFWIFPMALAMNVPNVVYVFLSMYTPQSMWLISGGVALEQFGYGFGFTALMLYMIHFAEGSHKTAHYAFCTGFMALGMMLPGMISGWVQEIVGYVNFFIWVVICTIPGLILIFYLKIDPSFGVKKGKT